jgi:parallel beta-helix repeat protein
MKKDGLLIGGIVALLFLFGTAHATIWYVHPDSTLNSIQAALDSCADNDTVLVAPGFYIENITWPSTDGIHLNSEYGPDTTIIDGDSAGIVITIITGVDSTTVINGFTIQNGAAYDAGGIFCYNNSSPTISNNIITGNVSGYGGGGIECYMYSSPTITSNTITNNTTPYGGGIECDMYSSPTITDNTIDSNTATYGGGIYCNNSSPTITDNTITGNTATFHGGGIDCWTNSSPTITNNTITGNESFYAGGGIGCYGYASPTITGNTITGNTAVHGGGIASKIATPTVTDNIITDNAADSLGGGIGFRQSSPTISHNIIEANTALCGGGIGCDSSTFGTIDSCTISGNNRDGVYCAYASSPVIHYCNITNNTGYGVRNIDPGVTVNAEHNWWGDPTGPGGFGPGTGDSVSDYVDFVPWATEPFPWGIEEHEPTQTIFTYLQISPNPFRDRVNIKFSIKHSAEVIELKIYDATGRMVKDFKHVINQQIFWNGTDDLNRKLPSGVYFLKFQAGDYSTTEKLLMIR